jgi:hypothetical protein
MRPNNLRRDGRGRSDSDADAPSDEAEHSASDGSEFTEDDEGLSGGPALLVEPPSAPATGRVWEAPRDEPWSAELRGLFENVWEGLNKASWMVYPGHVSKLLHATATLLLHGQPATRCVAARSLWCPRSCLRGALARARAGGGSAHARLGRAAASGT